MAKTSVFWGREVPEPCLEAITLQHQTRAFGHPAAGSDMQVPGKKSMASRWERYRHVMKNPSKHTRAQVSVKAGRANPLHHGSAAFDRALIGDFYSALTLFYQLLVCMRLF